MNRAQRLQPVRRVALSREQEAARELDRARRLLDEQQARLAELNAYRDEYAAGFLAAGSRGMGVAALRGYQAFLGQLDAAIAQQSTLVEQADALFRQRRQAWSAHHSKTRALDKALERAHDEERRAADRREQKDLDERSLRRHHPHHG
jgi:flagellar FliJ protein